MTEKKKISVWKCPEHGEFELIDYTSPKAFCNICGKEMIKIGEYEE